MEEQNRDGTRQAASRFASGHEVPTTVWAHSCRAWCALGFIDGLLRCPATPKP